MGFNRIDTVITVPDLINAGRRLATVPIYVDTTNLPVVPITPFQAGSGPTATHLTGRIIALDFGGLGTSTFSWDVLASISFSFTLAGSGGSLPYQPILYPFNRFYLQIPTTQQIILLNPTAAAAWNEEAATGPGATQATLPYITGEANVVPTTTQQLNLIQECFNQTDVGISGTLNFNNYVVNAWIAQG